MLPCALARRSGNLEGLAVGFDIFFAVCAWLDRLCLGEGQRCAAVGARGTRSSNVALRPVDLHAGARERTHTAVGRIPPCGWTRPPPAPTPTNTTYPTQATLSTNISAILPLHLHRRALPLLHLPSDPVSFPHFPPSPSNPKLRLCCCFNTPSLPSVSACEPQRLNNISSRTPLQQVTPRHSACQPSVARSIHHHHPNEIGTGSMAPSPSLFFFLSPGLNKKSDESGDLFSRGWGAWA